MPADIRLDVTVGILPEIHHRFLLGDIPQKCFFLSVMNSFRYSLVFLQEFLLGFLKKFQLSLDFSKDFLLKQEKLLQEFLLGSYQEFLVECFHGFLLRGIFRGSSQVLSWNSPGIPLGINLAILEIIAPAISVRINSFRISY